MLPVKLIQKGTLVKFFRSLLPILLAVCVMNMGLAAASAEVATPTVLITGSNRGTGLEFVRQYAARGWNVIATCRRPEAAEELQAMATQHTNVRIDRLDITDHAQVDALAKRYTATAIDVLLKNVALDLADEGVVVGLINPGIVDTRGFADIGPGDPVPDDFKQVVKLLRSGALTLSTPEESVGKMMVLIDRLTPEQSGGFLDADGQAMPL
jgi:NAD(P)-dependent dehydrogenase (short-subunit alcohol dehydrogenase family)